MTQPPSPNPRRFHDFWLRVFFWWTRHAAWGPRCTKRFFVAGAWRTAAAMREGVRDNLRHILGPAATDADLDRAGRAVVASFYDFVCEVGASRRLTRPQLTRRITSLEGTERYNAARQDKRGAVLVTAHFGNFEVGLAAIADREPRVHVVFRRDAMSRFEQVRARLHHRLGVIETPIDDGMASWMALRDALAGDAVVLLQGDRAMPGQRSLAVPFFDAKLRLPMGPAKLALMTGSPMVPVFAIRQGRGHVRIVLGEPIKVPTADAVEPALRALGRAIEAVVREYPEQWHVLHRAFEA